MTVCDGMISHVLVRVEIAVAAPIILAELILNLTP
jgi:hypothetical protein